MPSWRGLKDIFRTKNGTPFHFPSSGTGCWEAALTNTLVARRQSVGGTIWPIQPFVD
jgi:aspartate aminotransferase-like enzyme